MRTFPDMIKRCRGTTLIELIIFIIIIGVAVTGILTVYNVAVRNSSDPLVQKQAQAFAEGLLEEIQTGYFAYCDGADANLRYAKAAASCTTADSYGPEAGESRPYDTVKDYASAINTDTTIPATDLSGSLNAPAGYSAKVRISEVALGDIAAASGDALLIRVTVTGPGTTAAVAEGFKTRQVPQ